MVTFWSAALPCRFSIAAATCLCSSLLRASLPNRLQNLGDRFGARFGAEIAFAVKADAHGVCFHVAFADHEHGMHFHLLGALDFAVDLVGAFVHFGSDLMSAQFVQYRCRIIE